jgi:hypothetical protein
MAKTKRMFMGGAANAAMQSVKSAPKFNAPPGTPKGTVSAGAPPPPQLQFMSDKLRGAPPPPQLQFMSDKLRGGAGPQGPAVPQMQGLGQAMGSMPQGSPAKLGQLGAAMGKTMGGMGMKSGGTASSRADGCAVKGKTKGRFV